MRLFITVLCLICVLSGCGQSGKLYLPNHPATPDISDNAADNKGFNEDAQDE